MRRHARDEEGIDRANYAEAQCRIDAAQRDSKVGDGEGEGAPGALRHDPTVEQPRPHVAPGPDPDATLQEPSTASSGRNGTFCNSGGS